MADAALVRVIADFEARQRRNRLAQEKRFAHAVSLCPALAELENERLRLLFGPGADDAQATGDALKELYVKRAGLLESAGLPKDYLEMAYRCPDCRDTGFVGNPVKTRCACFVRRLNEERYAPNDKEILKNQSFENFDLGVFPNEIPPGSKTPQREYMRQLRDICLEYAKEFPENEKPNLLFYGNTGLGKTYLLNCITGCLLNRSFNVLRFTAFSLGEFCLQKHLGAGTDLSPLYGADLLVCDDLGSEPLYNNVTVEYFVSLFNERLLRAKHTIVATNLFPHEIQERYGERMVSRLLDAAHTRRFHLRGCDIRKY
jgi:DNA replication protein DnaC